MGWEPERAISEPAREAVTLTAWGEEKTLREWLLGPSHPLVDRSCCELEIDRSLWCFIPLRLDFGAQSK